MCGLSEYRVPLLGSCDLATVDSQACVLHHNVLRRVTWQHVTLCYMATCYAVLHGKRVMSVF